MSVQQAAESNEQNWVLQPKKTARSIERKNIPIKRARPRKKYLRL